MQKLLIFILLLSTSLASAESLKVLCWNIRNYLATDQVVDRQWRPDYPKPEHEKTALRSVLLEANADIIFFQEMGSEPYLRELQRDLAKLQLEYPYRAIGTDRDTVRHLAVLSKFPLHQIRIHQPGMRRGIMQVEFEWHNHYFQIFNIHLKSRFTVNTDDPHASRERLREMQHLLEATRQDLPPNSFTFLLGDFNEPPDGPARRHLLQSIPGLKLLPALDTTGTDYTFYWHRGDIHESIDAIYYKANATSHKLHIHAKILSSPCVDLASDHRPLLMKIQQEAK